MTHLTDDPFVKMNWALEKLSMHIKVTTLPLQESLLPIVLCDIHQFKKGFMCGMKAFPSECLG